MRKDLSRIVYLIWSIIFIFIVGLLILNFQGKDILLPFRKLEPTTALTAIEAPTVSPSPLPATLTPTLTPPTSSPTPIPPTPTLAPPQPQIIGYSIAGRPLEVYSYRRWSN